MGSLNDEMIDDCMKNYMPDLDGFQNVQPPEGWTPPEEETKEIQKVNVFTFVDSPTEVPFRSDIINVAFTPEQLHLLNEVLKRHCLDNPLIEYMEDEMKVVDRYEQQTYIRMYLIDKINMYIDDYIECRPFAPLLNGWVKRIGKEDVRKL